MAKKVTMQQIADYLGVSKFVVSKALSGKQGVSDVTRAKVLETASKLGYYPSKNNENTTQTTSLSSSSSNQGDKQVVLVLMPNIRFQTTQSSYWGKIINGISFSLEKHRVGMVIITENNIESLARVLNPEAIVGVISVGVVSTSLLLEINRLNIPLIMVDYEEALIQCDTIFHNNFDSSWNLTNYLLGLGHNELQFVGDIKYSRSFYDRFLGFRSSLEEHDISIPLDKRLYRIDMTAVREHFEDWVNTNVSSLPTVFVCANDNIAQKVIAVLTKRNFQVPKDISVTGFDNQEATYLESPTITTVNVAKIELGKRAVEMLFRRIAEPESSFEKVLLAGNMMLRESTAMAKSKNAD